MKRRTLIGLIVSIVAFLPHAAHAQQTRKTPTIGVLWHAGSAEEEGPNFKALLEGFKDLGYVDGNNIRFEHRFANENPEQFTRMAAELVSLKVDVLVSVGTVAAPYLKNATKTIPVVFTIGPDPIASKLVDSIAHPGGNVTGLTIFANELVAKRLEILKEAIPSLSRVGFLFNPNSPVSQLYLKQAQSAAPILGLALEEFEALSIDGLESAFDAMARAELRAAIISPEGLFFQGRAIIPKLALARRIATCVWSRETLAPGAFVSYGPDVLAVVRRAAVFVDSILKGAKPAELPVEEPTGFELIINLKTARALGLSVPPTLIARANEVIE